MLFAIDISLFIFHDCLTRIPPLSVHQEMRDTAYRLQQPGSSETLAEDKTDWRGKAKRFLQKQTKRSAEDEKAQPKRKAVKPLARLRAYDLLLAKDHVLSCITGQGIKQFAPQTEDGLSYFKCLSVLIQLIELLVSRQLNE